MWRSLVLMLLSVVMFAQTRTFTPTLRQTSPTPLSITQVDGNFSGIGNIANSAARSYFAGSQSAMLTLSPTPQAGDWCWRSDTTFPFIFLGGDATNLSNWATLPTYPSIPVSSVFGRTGAVTAQSGDYSVAQVTDAASASALAASTGSSMVGHISALSGAQARVLQSKARERISVFDFFTSAQIADVQAGALAQDVTTPIQTAVNAVAVSGGILWFPRGLYKTTATVRVGLARYTAAQYATVVGRTGVVTLTPNSANDISNDANFQSIGLEFERGAWLVPSWTAVTADPVVEYNLREYGPRGYIRGLKIINPNALTGTRYNWATWSNPGSPYWPSSANVYVAPTNKLIGLAVAATGLEYVDDVEVVGMQTGVLGYAAYWTTLSNVANAFCGDAINWAAGNASTLYNLRVWWSSRGLVCDGDAMEVSGFHTENVLDDFSVFESDASSFKNFYLEDDASTASQDGTGHSTILIGTASPTTVVASKFEGIRARAPRLNKKSWTVTTSARNVTLVGCRGGSVSDVVIDASATGFYTGGDFAAALPATKWSAIDGGIALPVVEGSSGSAALKFGTWLYATGAQSITSLASDANTTFDLTVTALPSATYYVCVFQATSATGTKLSITARVINSTTVRVFVQNTSSAAVTDTVNGVVKVEAWK